MVWDVFSTHLADMSHGCLLTQNELDTINAGTACVDIMSVLSIMLVMVESGRNVAL